MKSGWRRREAFLNVPASDARPAAERIQSMRFRDRVRLLSFGAGRVDGNSGSNRAPMKKVISLWNRFPLQSNSSSSRLPMRLLFVKLKHFGDAMHLAAACQSPTVAIFGPSVPWTGHPWGVASKLIAPESHEVYSGRFPEYGEIAALKTSDVAVAPVLEAWEELLAPGRDEPAESVEASQESSGVRSEQ